MRPSRVCENASATMMPVVCRRMPGSCLRSSTQTRRPASRAASAHAAPAKLAPTTTTSKSNRAYPSKPALFIHGGDTSLDRVDGAPMAAR